MSGPPAVVGPILITVQPYTLQLRSAFGTTHSVTTVRNNALIVAQMEGHGVAGYGEVGLPPKREHCYHADYDDVLRFHELVTTYGAASVPDADPFTDLPAWAFASAQAGSSDVDKACRRALLVLDFASQQASNQKATRAPHNGYEMAIMDLWSRLRGVTLSELIGVSGPTLPTYYTASLAPTLAETLDAARMGARFTPCLKIKLNNERDRAMEMLAALHSLWTELFPNGEYKWSIDANSAWTPESARSFMAVLEPYRAKISMVEQPFPPDVALRSDAEKLEWASIKREYEAAGYVIFGDESVSLATDVAVLKDFVHGVNAKLDKAGGLREVVRICMQAKAQGLQTWIGCMVCSGLSATAAAHLLPLADAGSDLDGALLVTEESSLFTNDFAWGPGGAVVLNTNPGIGVVRKPL